MFEPSLGLGHGQNDTEIGEVIVVQIPKTTGKRKNTNVNAGKAKGKRTIAKR